MNSDAIAINVALLPDQAMVRRAKQVNQVMLGDYPTGFALDERHVPHITLLQAFVRRGDLDTLGLKLQHIEIGGELAAEGFGFHDGGELGAGGFVISRPPWLLQAHLDALAVVAPLALRDGDSSAFVTSADECIGTQTIDYVRSYLQSRSGDNYHPHLSVGIAHTNFLHTFQNAGIEPFPFGIDGLGVYQLGNFGTCQRLLFSPKATDG